MKRLTFLAATVILMIFTVNSDIRAQENQPGKPTLDERIKAAEEENEKLKELKLRALLDENKRLKAELGMDAEKKDLTGILDNPTDKTNRNASGITGTRGMISDPGNANNQPLTSTNDAEKKAADFKPAADSQTMTGSSLNSNTTASPATISAGNPAATTSADDDNQYTKACTDFLKDKSPATNDMNLCLLASELLTNNQLQLSTSLNSLSLAKALSGQIVQAEKPADLDKQAKKFALDFQGDRTDKQVGADANKAGTTNLVSRASIPYIFNLAVENGAAVSTATGTTFNFRFNPVGLIEYLNNGQTDNFSFQPDETLIKHLRRTAFGLSYDTSRGVKTPIFTGTSDQLSGFSFSYGFVDQRKPSDELFQAKTKGFLLTDGVDFSSKAIPAIQNIFNLGQQNAEKTAIDKFVDKINTAINSQSANISSQTELDKKIGLLFAVLKQQFATAPVAELKSNTVISDSLRNLSAATNQYEKAYKEFRRKLNRSKLFTFDYNYDRSFTASDTSRLGIVFEKGWENGTEFIFDSSFSLFHKTIFRSLTVPGTGMQPPEQKRFRDFSFAAQYDVPLTGLTRAIGDSTLSFAAKYQRLLTNSVVLFDGTVVPNIKGDIFIGQAKLRLPIVGGLFLPFSFTYANRPELVKEKKSRGNIGFTFDLSSLLEKFSPFK